MKFKSLTSVLRPPVRSYLYPVIDLNGNGILRAIAGGQPATFFDFSE